MISNAVVDVSRDAPSRASAALNQDRGLRRCTRLDEGAGIVVRGSRDPTEREVVNSRIRGRKLYVAIR